MSTDDDDKIFNEQQVALEWIKSVESDKASIRDGDIYPLLKTWINKVSPKEILDLGCGQGICSEKIDLQGRVYTGLDLSFLLVDRAKKLYQNENRHFVVGSVYNLPFKDQYFDAAFSVSVWHLLEDLEKAAQELSRVLKPNGQFHIITANPHGYSGWKDLYVETKLKGKCLEGKYKLSDHSVITDVLYLHTFEEIMKSLHAHDLQVQETQIFRNSFISILGRKGHL